MSSGKTSQFQVGITFAELDKLLSLFERLADGVSKAASLPENERRQMRQSISETAEMIDSILTMVKQRISVLIVEIRRGDLNIRQHLIELDNPYEWEKHYREFHLCEPLRNAASELRENFVSRLKQFFVVKDRRALKKGIDEFIQSERMAGEFVSKILKQLTKLADKVDKKPEYVQNELEKARDSIQQYRDAFIDIERRMRSSM